MSQLIRGYLQLADSRKVHTNSLVNARALAPCLPISDFSMQFSNISLLFITISVKNFYQRVQVFKKNLAIVL